ncbi:MAG: hypothetical protein IKF61_03010 [Firmicutes bacterium]|nr:hypothetical protein [Bacillota bacterium]
MGKMDTKRKKCWEFMRRHGSITCWDAIKVANYTRLPDYIYKLKVKGINVRSIKEIGEDGTYSRYFIAPEEMRRAEEAHLVNV